MRFTFLYICTIKKKENVKMTEITNDIQSSERKPIWSLHLNNVKMSQYYVFVRGYWFRHLYWLLDNSVDRYHYEWNMNTWTTVIHSHQCVKEYFFISSEKPFCNLAPLNHIGNWPLQPRISEIDELSKNLLIFCKVRTWIFRNISFTVYLINKNTF